MVYQDRSSIAFLYCHFFCRQSSVRTLSIREVHCIPVIAFTADTTSIKISSQTIYISPLDPRSLSCGSDGGNMSVAGIGLHDTCCGHMKWVVSQISPLIISRFQWSILPEGSITSEGDTLSEVQGHDVCTY